jgi:hypothetical protein
MKKAVKVAVQMRALIAAMTARAGTTAPGPPAEARTGNAVRTMARFSSADRQTRLRSLKGGGAFSPGPFTARIAVRKVVGFIRGPRG